MTREPSIFGPTREGTPNLAPIFLAARARTRILQSVRRHELIDLMAERGGTAWGQGSVPNRNDTNWWLFLQQTILA